MSLHLLSTVQNASCADVSTLTANRTKRIMCRCHYPYCQPYKTHHVQISLHLLPTVQNASCTDVTTLTANRTKRTMCRCLFLLQLSLTSQVYTCAVFLFCLSNYSYIPNRLMLGKSVNFLQYLPLILDFLFSKYFFFSPSLFPVHSKRQTSVLSFPPYVLKCYQNIRAQFVIRNLSIMRAESKTIFITNCVHILTPTSPSLMTPDTPFAVCSQ
jgi:hypothetical protein